MKRTIALFSGGKDSFYSVQKILEKGSLDLIVSISSVSGDTQLHAGPEATREIRKEQLEGIGLPYRDLEIGTERNYLHQLFNGLQDIVKQENVGSLVTGDLWHPYTGGIGDMLAGALNVELIRPARDLCPARNHAMNYMTKVINSGIKAVIVSVRDGDISKDYVGREINLKLLDELEQAGVDVAAESGEYQSLVIASPIMDRHILISDYEVQVVNGKNGKEQFHRMKIKNFRVQHENQ